MSQKEIMDYLFKVKRPIKKQELNFLKINNISINRNLSRLEKFNFIGSTPSKCKKPKFYFLK
jgi:lysozyme family protein